jgi:methionine-rich copper-binding protein CopC
MTQCWTAPSTYGDTTNPTLASASPADNETAVTAGKSIVLNFSEKVDAETGNVTIHRTSDSTVVEAIDVSGSQVTGSGTSTITVNPAADLEWNTEYYVLIDATAFDDASSNSYAGISDTTALSFTTATVPGAPTALAGSRRIGEIALTWTAPSSNGGLAISDYIVEHSTDETTWTTFSDGGSSTASATVTGLANATTYTFRVSAVNTAGTGTASTTASATTVSVPAAPTGLTVQNIEGSSASLSWPTPSNGGSVITSHVVEFSSDAGATWTTSQYPSYCWEPDLCNNVVVGLVNGTAHLIRAAAVNALGTGNFSENLSFTTAG